LQECPRELDQSMSNIRQKLKDEPCIEFKKMDAAYDCLREQNFNNDYFEVWKSGLPRILGKRKKTILKRDCRYDR
jgi:hypothetical protein